MANEAPNAFFKRVETMQSHEIEAEISALSPDDTMLLLNAMRNLMLDDAAEPSDKLLTTGILLTRRLRSARANATGGRRKSVSAEPATPSLGSLSDILKA